MSDVYINAEYIAHFYGKGKETGRGEKWRTICPIHGDTTPSLDVTEINGRISFYCQVCGEDSNASMVIRAKNDGVWTKGGKVGGELWESLEQWKKNNPRPSTGDSGSYKPREDYWAEKFWEFQASYDYKEEDGSFKFQVVRLWDPIAREKVFMQYYLGPTGHWRAKAVRQNVIYIPYNLPEVARARREGLDVVLTEGEKDVETLRSHGQIASCNPMGWGKWDDAYTPRFKGLKRVYIVPDNDHYGYLHLNQVGTSFKKHGIELWVIELIGVQHKGDTTDWLQDNPFELFEELKKEAKQWLEPWINPHPKPNKKGEPEQPAAPPANAKAVKTESDLLPDGVASLPSIEIPFEALTDTGNGNRLVEQWSDVLKFCEGWGWVHWNGQRFAKDSKGAARELAKDTARNIVYDSQISDIRLRIKFAQKSLGTEKISAMLKAAQTDPLIAMDVDDFNRDHFIINCPSGVLDLRPDGEFIKDPTRRMKYFCTQVMACDVDFDRKPEMWLDYIRLVTNGDPARAEFLQNLAGYWLIGNTELQQGYFFHGDGENGKSVFLDTCSNQMGTEESGYAVAVRAEMFTKQPFESHSDNFSLVAGKRFAAVAEIDPGARIDEAKLKNFTGDSDLLRGRLMRHESFSFRNTAKVAFRCNILPRIVNQDHGIWRRILRVPFEHPIPVERRVTGFADMLVEEWPGILAWRVEGARRVIAKMNQKKEMIARRERVTGFGAKELLTIPDEFYKLTDDYRGEQDVVQAFLDECGVLYEDQHGERITKDSPIKSVWKISARQMMRLYQSYCKDFNFQAKNATRLGLELKQKGLIPYTDGKHRGYLGFQPHTHYNND